MKKSENLVATLLAIYAIILTLSIAIYALFKIMNLDVELASNLLSWSATIFAPVAVLMTYTSWREQRSAEVIAEQAKLTFKKIMNAQNAHACLKNSFMVSNCSYDISKKYFDNFHIARAEAKEESLFLSELVGDEALLDKVKIFNAICIKLQDYYSGLLESYNEEDRSTPHPDLTKDNPFKILKSELNDYVLFKK